MLQTKCENCGKSKQIYPSQLKKSKIFFCDYSCHRIYKNKVANPSRSRDLKGENNPMWGKHPKAWNKGLRGKDSHNWKGGVHNRKDGYVRVYVSGKRELLHRNILKDKLKEKNVVHHIDGNPSNNDKSNLLILPSQAEHARLHALQR